MLKLQAASNILTTEDPSLVRFHENINGEDSPRRSFRKTVSKIMLEAFFFTASQLVCRQNCFFKTPRQKQKQKSLRRTMSYTVGCNSSNPLRDTSNWHDIGGIRSMEREMKDELNRLSEKSLNLSSSSNHLKEKEQINLNKNSKFVTNCFEQLVFRVYPRLINLIHLPSSQNVKCFQSHFPRNLKS